MFSFSCARTFFFVILTLFLLTISNSNSESPRFRPSCVVDVKKDLNYDLVENWPQRFTFEGKPILVGQITGVDLEPNDQQVVLLHRADRVWDGSAFDENNRLRDESSIKHPTLLWLDRKNGGVLKVGGKGMFYMPHGITIDKEGFIWIIDVGSHQVYKISKENGIVMALGLKFQPGDGENQFCKPTDVAVLPNGDFFVSDGYCNSRVMMFKSDGSLIQIISPSSKENIDLVPGPKRMEVVHSLALDVDHERLFVADRENSRILVFRPKTGKYLFEIKSPKPVYAIAYNKNQGGVLHFVTGPDYSSNEPLSGYTWSFIGPQLASKWSPPGGFSLPHDLAVSDDNLDMFVAEIQPRDNSYKAWKFTQSRNRLRKILSDLITLKHLKQKIN